MQRMKERRSLKGLAPLGTMIDVEVARVLVEVTGKKKVRFVYSEKNTWITIQKTTPEDIMGKKGYDNWSDFGEDRAIQCGRGDPNVSYNEFDAKLTTCLIIEQIIENICH